MQEAINHFLRRRGCETDIRSLIYHIARACKYINFSIRAGHTGYEESQNASGEVQLKLDVMSDKIIQRELEKSELCALCVSEEQEHPIHFDHPRGAFTVAYDPLDGSSLFDANFAVGSIFGIWEGDALVGQSGREMIAAVYCLYGPRVMLVIALQNGGTHELEMNDVGEFILVREDIKIKPETKYFAPGNMRATITNKCYRNMVNRWIDEGRTLRYSGGMVPDLHHILAKQHGIFAYPEDDKNPHGKLRLAFECMPMALIFEAAGGKALSTQGRPILDMEVQEIHQRTPIVIGSANEVDATVLVCQG